MVITYFDEITGYYNIDLDRGDTASIKVMLYKDNTQYIPSGSDTAMFAMARTWGVEPVFTKTMSISSDNCLLLELDTDDTKNLAIRQYVYGIKFKHGNNVITVVKGRFVLGPEVGSSAITE